MNPALSVSREERAYQVVKLCELASRGLVPDLNDAEDASMELLKGSFDAIATKIRYLLRRASAAWKPEFERVLDSSHSLRVEKIDGNKKEAKRGYTGTCMACGRTERNCRYSIDLAGELSAFKWLTHPLNVHDEYKKFCESYEIVLNASFVEEHAKRGRLPSTDKGTFIVGETCLRKAKLRYMLQTLLLETCYTCDRDMESLAEKNCKDVEDFETSQLYTITSKKCKELVKYQDRLELAIADERRAVPEVACDAEFWSVIDAARALVSNNDEDEFNRIIRERAFESMDKFKALPERERDADEDSANFSTNEQEEGEEGEEGEEDGTEEDKEHSKKKEEDDDVDDYPKSRHKRRRSCIVDDGDDDSDDYGDDDCGVSDVDTSPPPSRLPRREPWRGMSGMVGKQRACGSLPSRRDAVVRLMDLQSRLQREDRVRDSAVCTTAILTLQELLQKVEEMRHTL